MRRLVCVTSVEPLDGYRVRLGFEDGAQREVDLGIYLHGPVFDSIRRDLAVFRSLKVEHGTVVWPNGADIDPDVLYYGLKPAWVERAGVAAKQARRPHKQASAGLAVRESGEEYAASVDEETTTS